MTEAAPNANESTTASTTDTTSTAPVTSATQQATEPPTTDSSKTSTADPDTGATTDPAKPAGAPEAYQFTAPEGSQLDDQVIAAYSEVAKELNLTQESAQKVLDKVAPIMAQRQVEQIRATHEAWVGAAQADKEYGGDKLNENLAVAKKALETFGTPELTALLRESGLGSHPEVIRFFYRTGKQISEDTVVRGSVGAGGKKDAASALYPNHTH